MLATADTHNTFPKIYKNRHLLYCFLSLILYLMDIYIFSFGDKETFFYFLVHQLFLKLILNYE